MIIQRMFSGEIYPGENVAPRHDQEYVQLCNHVSALLTQLKKTLSEADYMKVDELHTELMSIQHKEAEANFGYGLAVGVQLVIEIMETLKRYK